MTQLETVPIPSSSTSRNYFQRSPSGYEKLPTSEPSSDTESNRSRSKWSDRSPNRQWTTRVDKDRHKSEELVDNKKNELAEKKLVESEKQRIQREKEAEKQLKKELKEEKKKAEKEAKAKKKS